VKTIGVHYEIIIKYSKPCLTSSWGENTLPKGGGHFRQKDVFFGGYMLGGNFSLTSFRVLTNM
jgi:hypothetical protein